MRAIAIIDGDRGRSEDFAMALIAKPYLTSHLVARPVWHYRDGNVDRLQR